MLARRGNPQPDVTVSSTVPGAKEKKRKSEKRKEKSRDAARCRRSRESEIFQELSEQLPICPKSMAHLDKASLVRLAIGYLKIRHLISAYKGLLDKEGSNSFYDSFYLPSIDGFLLVMSQDGDMIYLSENVHKYLGISQVDLMGHSIFEYSHPCDHDEVREVLQSRLDSERQGPFSLFVRMKCALTQKGKNINMRSASFKVIHCTGHILRCVSLKPTLKGPVKETEKCLVSLGEPVPHPSNIEVPLNQQSFLSRHSLDMKFTYVDARMTDVLGYKSEDIMGKSVYLFYHACDATTLERSFKILFSKGQSETGRYRFLAKRGGFVWLLTQATLIYESGSSKPQCVVCVNYVLSGQERQDEVVSLEQVAACKMPLETVKVTEVDAEAQAQEEGEEAGEEEEKEEEEEVREIEKEVIHEEERASIECSQEEVCLPQANTFKIFAPRTADMNKGFLTFDDDSGRTVLKEEPEDLTHLAPQAGDVCFPLDMSISYPDLMDDAFLPCSLGEESSNISDLECLHNSNNFPEGGCSSDSEFPPAAGKSLKSPLTNDPFFCLREDEEEAISSDYNTGLSNHPLFKSPDKLSLNESRKAKDIPRNVDVSSTACRTDNLDIQEDCLSDCAPYIPMNDEDDILLNPGSSLLLDTALGADSQSFGDMEDIVSPPVGSALSSLTKFLKRDRTLVNVSSTNNIVKFPRNDLHSDGSSECADEYDSDPLEQDMNSLQFGKNTKLLVNPNSVFGRSSVSKPSAKIGPFRKQFQLMETPPQPEAQSPRDRNFHLSGSVKDHRTLGRKNVESFHLESRITSIERKQPFPSPPDPPPKRNGPHLLRPLDSPKKMKMDPRLLQNNGTQGSVLLNLLVRGEDASHGYLCPANHNDHLKYKLLPEVAILDKPLNTQPKMSLALHTDVHSTQRAQNLML